MKGKSLFTFMIACIGGVIALAITAATGHLSGAEFQSAINLISELARLVLAR